MIDVLSNGYAQAFGAALGVTWLAAIFLGRGTARQTACMLTVVWLGTLVSNWATGGYTAVAYYFLLDIAGVWWLYDHQRRNWQWMVAALFALMILTHAIFLFGYLAGWIEFAPRPYQDILAGLAYAQLGVVGWTAYERWRQRTERDPILGTWAFDSDWVLRERLGHSHHESPS